MQALIEELGVASGHNELAGQGGVCCGPAAAGQHGRLVSFAVKSRSSALGDQFCSLFAEQSPRFAVKSRSNGVPFLSLTRPFTPHLERTARPDLPRIWLVRRFGACTGPRAFPKGTLHLNRGAIAPTFAPGFKCKIRDFIAQYFCI
jgi:hypothetical protein